MLNNNKPKFNGHVIMCIVITHSTELGVLCILCVWQPYFLCIRNRYTNFMVILYIFLMRRELNLCVSSKHVFSIQFSVLLFECIIIRASYVVIFQSFITCFIDFIVSVWVAWFELYLHFIIQRWLAGMWVFANACIVINGMHWIHLTVNLLLCSQFVQFLFSFTPFAIVRMTSMFNMVKKRRTLSIVNF